jgi:hypothetical protein
MRKSLILLSYLLLIAFSIWHHEMWRDEIQAWDIVLNSDSVLELFQNIRYEGHPLLWFLLLWPFTFITDSPYAIQFAHFFLTAFAAYLIVFRSPLQDYEKVFLLFSYFMFYEYSVISRNYMIGVVLMLTIAILWKDLTKNIGWISLLIFLLFQTSAMMALMSVAILFALLIEFWLKKEIWKPRFIIPFLFAASGFLLFIFTTLPPADSSYASSWNFKMDMDWIVRDLILLGDGLVVRPTTIRFLRTSDVITNTYIDAMAGLLFALAILVAFRKDLVAFLFLLCSFGILFTFFYLKDVAGARHVGHFTLALVFAIWISYQKSPLGNGKRIIFALILFLKLPLGLVAQFKDWKGPYSHAENVAHYIETRMPENVQIAGGYNYLATPVAGFLEKDILFLNDGRIASYVIWRSKYWNEGVKNMPEFEVLRKFASTVDVTKSNVLITKYNRENEPGLIMLSEGQSRRIEIAGKSYRISCIKAFTDAITWDENYYLFQLSAWKENISANLTEKPASTIF